MVPYREVRFQVMALCSAVMQVILCGVEICLWLWAYVTTPLQWQSIDNLMDGFSVTMIVLTVLFGTVGLMGIIGVLNKEASLVGITGAVWYV